MFKIVIIFGTRPEAIKLAPVIKKLKEKKNVQVIVCSTGQHREMLRHVLDIFQIEVDYDLDLMKKDQDLFDISAGTLEKLKIVFNDLAPNFLIVQGDTTTAFISALAAYYKKIKIGHIEAGLRSFNIYSPFPEEANRKFISSIASLHFAPTRTSYDNLLNEGVKKNTIVETGNTVIDALLDVKKLIEKKEVFNKINQDLSRVLPENYLNSKIILITMHRREKFGEEFESILYGLKDLASEHPNALFVYPVHLNPNVQKPVNNILRSVPNFILIPPQNYLNFIFLMSQCYFILSDSGGVQEECFVFNKPIIVMRDVTERTEAIDAGYAFLVGSDIKKLKQNFGKISNNIDKGYNYFKLKNPFGDGKASERIVKKIFKEFNVKE